MPLFIILFHKQCLKKSRGCNKEMLKVASNIMKKKKKKTNERTNEIKQNKNKKQKQTNKQKRNQNETFSASLRSNFPNQK